MSYDRKIEIMASSVRAVASWDSQDSHYPSTYASVGLGAGGTMRSAELRRELWACFIASFCLLRAMAQLPSCS